MQGPLRHNQHRVRDSLRCHSSRQPEARRPVTFGGLGDGADGLACRAALCAASIELQKSQLRGLMAGALWTAARVLGHGTRTNSACPHCGAAHEDGVHILWDCPEWEHARGTWRPWLNDVAAAIPQLGPMDQWPACLWKAGLSALRLAQGGGSGAPGRVLVPPARNVPGGPRCPYGCGPQGPGRPRGLPVPGPPAAAAPQPLPLG